MLIRKLNMPKGMWDGSEEPTVNHLYTLTILITENFEYALKIADQQKPTAVFHINRSRKKYSLATSVLVDSYDPPAETKAKWKK